MTTAVVFDYGFGNVRSMVRALADLGSVAPRGSALDARTVAKQAGARVPGYCRPAAAGEAEDKEAGKGSAYRQGVV